MATAQQVTVSRPGSLWTLAGLTPWQFVLKLVREMEQDDIFGRASELAFNCLFALFPLVLFMLALFGLFASSRSQLEGSLLSFCANFLPPAAYQLLSNSTVELSTNAGGGKITFGIIVGFWFASGGMSSVMSTLNVAYRVRESRRWIHVRAIAMALTLTTSILLLSALFMVMVGASFVDWVRNAFHWTSIFVDVWRKLQWPLAGVFVMSSFSMLYYFGPNRAVRRWHWITPGSLFGAVLWLVVSGGFRIYLHFFNTYSTTYGSLGAVMILLVWLYVTGLAFLTGGAIDATIERAASDPAPLTKALRDPH
jgi:membrane protein